MFVASGSLTPEGPVTVETENILQEFEEASTASSLNHKFDFILDPKKRLQIPSDIRQLLKKEDDGTFILTKGKWSCIFAFPKSVWEQRKKRIADMDLTSVEQYQRLQLLNASSATCPMDKQFRIKVPDELLAFAGLTKDATIVGVDDRLEIWDKQRADAYYKRLENDIAWDDLVDDLLL